MSKTTELVERLRELPRDTRKATVEIYDLCIEASYEIEELTDRGITEGLHRGIELMLYVLIDKHAAPMDDVQQLARELNHAAGCVAEGYVTWADIRQMLKEYDVEVVLE